MVSGPLSVLVVSLCQPLPSVIMADSQPPPSNSPSSPANPNDPALLQKRIDFLMQEGARVVAEKEALAAKLATVGQGGKGLRPPPVPLFHGAMGYEIDVWVREMNEQFEFEPLVYPANDEMLRVRTAARYLKGTAADWWHHEDKSSITTWDAFVDRLYGRFRPMQQAEFARTRLKHLRQTGGVSAYCNLFQREIAPIKNMHVDEQLFWFKEGLDVRIRAEIIKREPKTLHAAMDDAVKIEAYLGNARGPGLPFAPRAGYGQSYTRHGAGASSGSVPMEVSMVQEGEVVDQEFAHFGLLGAESHVGSGPAFTTSPSEPASAAAGLMTSMLRRMESMEKMFVASMQGQREKGQVNKSASGSSSNNRIPNLDPALRQERMRTGGCLRCGQQGHWKNDRDKCPAVKGATTNSKPLNA